MNITAIVILYNSCIENSKTIQSLIDTDNSKVNLHIIIWNNGPNKLSFDECKKYKNIFEAHKIQLSIYENIKNIALSKIYNTFIVQSQFDYFSIFDQDSILDKDFFQNINSNTNFDVIVPAIYSSGWRNKENSLCFPVYNITKKIFDKQVFSLGEIESISSGLTISNQLVNLIKKDIFNENYALYAIDTCFFLDLSIFQNTQLKGICVGRINHSLDFNIQNPQKISQTRRLEMEYSKVLNKLFYTKKSRLSVFLYISRKFMKKEYSLPIFIKLINCIFKKKHPRACIPITVNKLL